MRADVLSSYIFCGLDDCVCGFQGVKVSDLGRPKEMSEQVYQIMASMTILVTQLVVEFAKNVPGFSDLERDDQITLLKVSYM